MSSKVSFEQLCIRLDNGYSCDESTAYQPQDPENFEEVFIKLSSKIETSIFLIETHKGQLDEFTFISIPVPPLDKNGGQAEQFLQTGERNLCIGEVWKSMHNIGWDSLQVLSILDKESLPDNGSRVHSLSTFVTCLLESLKSYFLFQKPKLSYAWTEVSNASQVVDGGVALAIVWKNSIPLKLTATPISKARRVSRNFNTPIPKRRRIEEILPEPFISSPLRRELTIEEESESEEEITFKNYTPKVRTPSPVRQTISVKQPTPSSVSTRIRRVTRGRPLIEENEYPVEETLMETGNSVLADVTLGFEMSEKAPSRRSVMRKSMVPDWPEEEKQLILGLYDNLNPNISEQKRIVLTCRYVLIQYEKELTSKVFYNWIQKKGRKIERTIETFELSEDQEKTEMIDFFKSLNPSQPENTRIAFTLKYFLAQFNVTLPSKQLYAWLSDKPTKRGRKSMR